MKFPWMKDITMTACFRSLPFGFCLLFVSAGLLQAQSNPPDPMPNRIFDVRDYGAVGDGAALDTASMNKTIEACAAAGGGQVRIPPGTYLSGTVHLKSHVSIVFESGARLVGSPDLEQYQHWTPEEAKGSSRRHLWNRALILGDGVEDVTLSGAGLIDGNKVFDPNGEEKMRGPHTIFLGNCRRVTLRDLSITDSANYAILFMVSDQIDIANLTVTGGWDGVHFRGRQDRPCRDVTISDCRFFTGDDSIAGSYWNNVLITGCVLNSSCNGIRLIGPAEHLIVHNCLFYGPGKHEHRTSHRTNMLAGITLQPSAWGAMEGPLDDVTLSDLTMHNVSTPFSFVLKPGNTGGRISVSRVSADGVNRVASSVESWAEQPFEYVAFRDVSIEFEGGGTTEPAHQEIKAPGTDVRSLPAWAFYARNVKHLLFENVRFDSVKEDLRPVMVAENVEQLTLRDFGYSHSSSAEQLFRLDNVANLQTEDTDLPADVTETPPAEAQK